MSAYTVALQYPGVQRGRYVVTRAGSVFDTSKTPRRKLVPGPGPSGAPRVTLQKSNASRTRVYIHRLICFVFNGPPRGANIYVKHLDGDVHNNRPSNLMWHNGHSDERRLRARAAKKAKGKEP